MQGPYTAPQDYNILMESENSQLPSINGKTTSRQEKLFVKQQTVWQSDWLKINKGEADYIFSGF